MSYKAAIFKTFVKSKDTCDVAFFVLSMLVHDFNFTKNRTLSLVFCVNFEIFNPLSECYSNVTRMFLELTIFVMQTRAWPKALLNTVVIFYYGNMIDWRQWDIVDFNKTMDCCNVLIVKFELSHFLVVSYYPQKAHFYSYLTALRPTLTHYSQKQSPEVFYRNRRSWKFHKLHSKTPVPESLF